MDRIDHAIVDQLAVDGRLSNLELATRIGLSPSSCLRRVRKLEHDGVIEGYRAVVNDDAMGRGFKVTAYIDLRGLLSPAHASRLYTRSHPTARH